jgi:Xaa-Pro aminopeptidase
MVITIEPGLYLPASKEISGVWAGLGVRIEDTILVTKTGGEVLTSALPKGVREIEKLMNQQARYKS